MISSLMRCVKQVLKRDAVERSSRNPQRSVLDSTDAPTWQDTRLFYSQLIKEGDLCFDVGANVGNKTSIFLKMGARVVCVEPQPKCVDILKGKYQKDFNVVIVSKGLAARRGRKALSICESADTISTFSEQWKTGRFRSYVWKATVDVPVTTLDTLIQEFGLPKLCKIDVEGFEYEVLQGLSTPIPFISYEFAREFIREARLCTDYLSSLGRAEFNYSLGEVPAFILSDWVDRSTLFESIEQNTDPLLWGDIYVRFPLQ